ncbi:MAG: hypothetical protein QXK88_01035 [Desulfurococcaceae archaeon]
MSLYKPNRGKRKAIEEALKDLDPATRELARSVLRDMIEGDKGEIDKEDLLKRIEKLKKEAARSSN